MAICPYMPEKLMTVTPSGERNETAIPAEQDFQTDTVTIPVKLCNLPPFHSVANQVLALSSDPDVDLQQLAAVMQADAAFAAEVLLLANSSLFGFTSRMHVLRHAVAILGLERIKALAVTVAMRAFLVGSTPAIRPCWRHSTACAVVAEEIALLFDFSGDRAYTAGLMHDIGRLGLLKSYASDVAPVLAGEYKDMNEVLRAERAAVNVDHGVAGSWLMKNWAFPETFSEICEHHHKPLDPTDSPLLQLVKISCRIADSLGYAAVITKSTVKYDEMVSALPAHFRRGSFPSEEHLQETIARRLSAFEQ